jgi:hypothetical protein
MMKGYEWIAGVGEDKETGKLLFEVWIRNGEQLANNLCAIRKNE